MTKLYYTLPEVAKKLDTTDSFLRFMIRNTGCQAKRRGGNGKQMFTHKEIYRLTKIKELHDTGEYTWKGIIKRML